MLPNPFLSTLPSTSVHCNSILAVAQAQIFGAIFYSFLRYTTPSGPSSNPVTLTSEHILNSPPPPDFH